MQCILYASPTYLIWVTLTIQIRRYETSGYTLHDASVWLELRVEGANRGWLVGGRRATVGSRPFSASTCPI